MEYISPSVNDPLVGNLNPDGSAPSSRIKNPDALHQVYLRLKQSDDVNARNRAEVDAMFDGASPWDDNVLRQAGMASRCNLNFGEAEFILEAALAGYIDLINSVENLISVKVREKDPQKKSDYEQIIAAGFTKMLREWDEFFPKYMLNANYFVKHGVSVTYWEDEYDWRWQVSKIGDFLLPRRTWAIEDAIEIAVSPRIMRAHELYSFIRDEERAEEIGWDVDEVKKAIMANTGAQSTYHITDWERYEEDLKNNDLFVAHGSGSEVRVIHGWVKEYDGTISHYISLADGSNDDFLYQKRGRFSKACDAFVTFTYGVGTNGFYQAIRGLGYKIFPHIQVSNRMRCQFVDGAMLSTSLLIQPESEEALENLAFEYLGPFSVLQSGVNIVDKQLPNIGQNAIPVLQDMTEQLQRRAGSYSAPTGNPSPQERTKFEVQAQLQGSASLTTGAMNLFYEPWTRLLRGAFKRATRKDYLSAERGGQQVAAFKKYCTERGVPLDVLFNQIEEVNAVRAIGAGSDQLRLVAMDEMMQMLGQFDEQGKQNVLRDRLAVRVGYDQVDRYVPKQPDSRPVIDQKIAELENAAMAQGKQIQVSPSENHFVHAQVHISDIAQQAQALKQSQIDPQQAVTYYKAIAPHATQHMEQVAQDASRKQEYAQLKKTMQQAGEIFEQTSEKVQAQQAQQAQSAQQPQQTGSSPEDQVKLQAHQQELQMEAERHQQKMALEAAEAKQKLALRDAETAQKIRAASAAKTA
jgi:hypothetical protein